MTAFASRVLAVVRRIPPGRIATYGDVAAAAGKPRAARAVGNIMRDCTARDVPCHRVVAAAGRLGGYGGNLELKRALLRAEGLVVVGDRIRNHRERKWAGHGQHGPRTTRATDNTDNTGHGQHGQHGQHGKTKKSNRVVPC